MIGRRHGTNRRGSELTTNTIILIIIGLLILGAVLWTFKGQIARFISGTEELSSCQGALGSVAGTGKCKPSCDPGEVRIGKTGCSSGYCCIIPAGTVAPGVDTTTPPPGYEKDNRTCAISAEVYEVAKREGWPIPQSKALYSVSGCSRSDGYPAAAAVSSPGRCYYDPAYAKLDNPPCYSIGTEKLDFAKKVCAAVASNPATKTCDGLVGLQQSMAKAYSGGPRYNCYAAGTKGQSSPFCCYYDDSYVEGGTPPCYATSLDWMAASRKPCSKANAAGQEYKQSDAKCLDAATNPSKMGYPLSWCGVNFVKTEYRCYYSDDAGSLPEATCRYTKCST